MQDTACSLLRPPNTIATRGFRPASLAGSALCSWSLIAADTTETDLWAYSPDVRDAASRSAARRTAGILPQVPRESACNGCRDLGPTGARAGRTAERADRDGLDLPRRWRRRLRPLRQPDVGDAGGRSRDP